MAWAVSETDRPAAKRRDITSRCRSVRSSMVLRIPCIAISASSLSSGSSLVVWVVEGGAGGGCHRVQGHGLPALPFPEVVYHQIVSDAEQPRREGVPSPSEGADGFQHPDEDVGRYVLGLRRTSHLEGGVAEYPLEEAFVQGRQRGGVPFLSLPYQLGLIYVGLALALHAAFLSGELQESRRAVSASTPIIYNGAEPVLGSAALFPRGGDGCARMEPAWSSPR